MNNTTSLVAACALLLSFIAHGQSPQSPQSPPAPARRPLAQNAPRLFREGREVFATPEIPADTGAARDASRLDASGTLALARDARPGSYVLQLVVGDTTSGGKPRTATQWIDFAVVK